MGAWIRESNGAGRVLVLVEGIDVVMPRLDGFVHLAASTGLVVASEGLDRSSSVVGDGEGVHVARWHVDRDIEEDGGDQHRDEPADG
jgi:hypothetical protein